MPDPEVQDDTLRKLYLSIHWLRLVVETQNQDLLASIVGTVAVDLPSQLHYT